MLAELTQKSLEPGFWNDQTKAQSTLRKRADVEQKLEVAQTLGRAIDDTAEYLELAAAENDETALADCEKQVVDLDARRPYAEVLEAALNAIRTLVPAKPNAAPGSHRSDLALEGDGLRT